MSKRRDHFRKQMERMIISSQQAMTTVSIIQREIPHYRIRFFEELFDQAAKLGLAVTVYSVASGEPGSGSMFAHRTLPARRLSRNKNGPLWITALTAALAGSDIIIAPQELQCVNVPWLWANRHRLCTHWIWWGHGHNFQTSTSRSFVTRLMEAVKRFMTTRSNGLITYTEKGAAFWRQRGMPADLVAPYYNTLDVEGLRAAGARVSHQQLVQLRQSLRLKNKRVLLFSGRLYPEKKVDFLLRAVALLQAKRPDVALLILGNGQERARLEKLQSELGLSDVHFLGAVTEPTQAGAYFQLADILVVPGLVGLAIVHGFAFGLPLATTDLDFHSPEIEYLSAENGIMTNHDVTEYADAIGIVLGSAKRLQNMQEAARLTGDQLRLAESVKRFLDAVVTFSGHQHPAADDSNRIVKTVLAEEEVHL